MHTLYFLITLSLVDGALEYDLSGPKYHTKRVITSKVSRYVLEQNDQDISDNEKLFGNVSSFISNIQTDRSCDAKYKNLLKSHLLLKSENQSLRQQQQNSTKLVTSTSRWTVDHLEKEREYLNTMIKLKDQINAVGAGSEQANEQTQIKMQSMNKMIEMINQKIDIYQNIVLKQEKEINMLQETVMQLKGIREVVTVVQNGGKGPDNSKEVSLLKMQLKILRREKTQWEKEKKTVIEMRAQIA